MLDAHCHLDQLETPEREARRLERCRTTVVAVTNLPSHYAMAVSHLEGFRYIHPALGLHPLLAQEHRKEVPVFLRLIRQADYVGELGLDFSWQGRPTKAIQLASLEAVLPALRDRPRFVTVHSRSAEQHLLDLLTRHGVGPVAFHWFSGSTAALRSVISSGHYISVNPAMILSESGRDHIAATPRDRILTETDAPHIEVAGRRIRAGEVQTVISHLAGVWQCGRSEVEARVLENFQRLVPKHCS